MGLSIWYYHRNAMMCIAEAIGNPIKVDLATKSADKGRYARALAEECPTEAAALDQKFEFGNPNNEKAQITEDFLVDSNHENHGGSVSHDAVDNIIEWQVHKPITRKMGHNTAGQKTGSRVMDPMSSSSRMHRITPPSSVTTPMPSNSHKRRRPASLQASPSDAGDPSRSASHDAPNRSVSEVLANNDDNVSRGKSSFEAVVEDCRSRKQGEVVRDGEIPVAAVILATGSAGSAMPGLAGISSAVPGSQASSQAVQCLVGVPSVVVQVEEPASSVPGAVVHFAH
ncbi:hypothetical protein PIB30_032163 [Stylosanthes scabra]|uniref:Uncharacterized protein n=1 Tax=Stylosanthes scabra TaxID=79078 RepID=A0ABU6Z8W7_9FABA|nr:hypothetical protein [Stylosanthes scabra]